jgi:hypothetical protein
VIALNHKLANSLNPNQQQNYNFLLTFDRTGVATFDAKIGNAAYRQDLSAFQNGGEGVNWAP